MAIVKVERKIGEQTLSIETGKLARQAHGSAVVQYGDTVVFAAVVTDKAREGIDFFPLTVDYREKTSAAGKFPGGFIKREGRPTNKEILTMRLIDRPIRPLFPKEFRDEVQIQAMVMSADQQNEPDILAIIAASAALSVSHIPFQGPIGAVRVGRVDGQFVINPNYSQTELSDMELVIAGQEDAVNMIEFGGQVIEESVVADSIAFAHTQISEICSLINELTEKAGKEKTWQAPECDSDLYEKVRSLSESKLHEIKGIAGKQERNQATDDLYESVVAELCPEGAENAPAPDMVKQFLHEIEEKVVRDRIVQGNRPDGRGPEDIRQITSEVSVLPRTHGSAIFTRGETQAFVVTTLGTTDDEQIVDGLAEEYSKKFMLHYNFPSFSVGEVRPIRGPGRREIGHGALAERCLEAVMPAADVFPYTVRLVSDILESNGSSSMASTCGGTLALMDAGVPITAPVAGISVGLVTENDQTVLLTDIIGEEDHFGDMDFKVAGTTEGITGIQLDLKIRGLTHDIIVQTLERARQARLKILEEMARTIEKPRPEISIHAPRLLTIRIPVDKIGMVIGPGGKGVKGIQEDTGAHIGIEDDGTVYISCANMEGAEAARNRIAAMTEEVEIGKTYTGRVQAIKDFGAFVEVLPGQDGLCHISELSDQFVDNINDVCKVGDMLQVKVIDIDDNGRIRLSHRVLLTGDSDDEGRSGGDSSDHGKGQSSRPSRRDRPRR